MSINADAPPELVHYHSILEKALLGVLELNPEGNVLWANSVFANMLGYESHELLGMANPELLHPDDRAASKERIANLFKSFVPLRSADRRYRHKDGHYIWLNITASVMRNAKGEALYLMGVFQDVSEKKRQDAALLEAEAKLNAVLNGLQDVVWSFSARENKLLFINTAATWALYGRNTKDFYANPDLWIDVVHPEDRELARGIWNTLALKGISDEKYRIQRPDGETRWVNSRAWVTMGIDGKPLRFEGVVRDVTEQRKLQETIEAQRGNMMAASKMSALGEMAGGLAHEINNPLAIIQGNSRLIRELLSKPLVDIEKIGVIAKTIEQTSDRISKITRSLRWFARDGVNDPLEKISINSLVEQTIEFCHQRFLSEGIGFTVEPFDPNLAIECRPVQISQVLLNLLNNAHDAVESLSEKWIRLSVIDLDSRVELRVTDSGRGVPPAVREKIFQPFFTTKEPGRGTGLGLSMSAGIIGAHGGILKLDSKSKNTCFVVNLPKHQSP